MGVGHHAADRSQEDKTFSKEPRNVAMINSPHSEVEIISWSMFEVDTDANVARKNIGNR